jgi:phosphatidylserine decarboxylase
LDESRVYNRWPVAKEGLPFILPSAGVTLLFLYLGVLPVAILTGLISFFIIFFFRDPDRRAHVSPRAVLAPADGKILEVKSLGMDDRNPLGEPAVRVSIFMSVFNVHVNRIPVSGAIRGVAYHPGKFFSANLDKASQLNEKNTVILESDDSLKIVFVQIAGLIARRIVCWVTEGDAVTAGQRFGLIRFGSRVEVYLPRQSRITARKGEKVKGGRTVIGYLA